MLGQCLERRCRQLSVALRMPQRDLRGWVQARANSGVHLTPPPPPNGPTTHSTLSCKQERKQATCALRGGNRACRLPAPAFPSLSPAFLELRKTLHIPGPQALPGPSRSSGYPDPTRGQWGKHPHLLHSRACLDLD